MPLSQPIAELVCIVAVMADAVVMAEARFGEVAVNTVATAQIVATDLADLWMRFEGWALDGYRRVPALMLGLAAALALPPLAIAGFLLTSRRRRERQLDEVPKSIPVSAWRQQAWLEVLDGEGGRFDIERDLVRIGRADDNDLRLVDDTIHRYHAVIERSPEMIFTVQDVSGSDGNGVRLDGRRIGRVRLRGGEVVDVGAVRLRFHLTEGQDGGRRALRDPAKEREE